MANMTDRIIAKTNARDKVVDFRDNLVPSGPDAYAMLHGMGGSKHATKSTIKMMICDYTRGTGNNSVSVSANLTPDIIAYLYKVSEEALLASVRPCITLSENGAKSLRDAKSQLTELYRALKGENAGLDTGEILKKIQAVGQIVGSLEKEADAKAGPTLTYSQNRVNSYRIDANGMAPVTYLEIKRNGMRNGEKARYPWYLSIKTGIAKTVKQATGACSFDGKTFQKQAEAFINVDDESMHRMMSQCVHFISVWENAMCLTQVVAGVQTVQQEREQYRANSQY